MNPSQKREHRSRWILTLILFNALLFGGTNVLLASPSQQFNGHCGCCGGGGGNAFICCQLEGCSFGQTCCNGPSECTNTNCTG